MQPKLDGEKCWWQHWAAVGQYDVELPHWAGAASAPAAAAPPTMDVRHTESHTRIIAGRCDMQLGASSRRSCRADSVQATAVPAADAVQQYTSQFSLFPNPHCELENDAARSAVAW